MTGATLSVLPASVEEKLSRPHFAIRRPASFGKQTLHARDGFTPRYDGQDRWMLRVFGVNDPARVAPLAPHQPPIVRA
ncbi:hypothetical protein UCMB321_3759 [Pseudomonas batumici]|uniref:Uncharacterized protein n=2 Tax=Pseudomonas batumici TaxID=226910 RepID=A0A0C2EUZ4_9PSED|nr:hypothetical protein UCMB321_3759 [Pseudomonas batumici]